MTSQAYKGYLIMQDIPLGRTWIEKGGMLIGWAKDVADAKQIIDGLVVQS